MIFTCVGLHRVTYGGDPNNSQFEKASFTLVKNKDIRFGTIEFGGKYEVGKRYQIEIKPAPTVQVTSVKITRHETPKPSAA